MPIPTRIVSLRGKTTFHFLNIGSFSTSPGGKVTRSSSVISSVMPVVASEVVFDKSPPLNLIEFVK